MGEIRLSRCCRLCLKEGFSLTNIFSQRSASGDPLYQILNFIYEMKVYENDGLPSQICSPCMWRMIEFDACKKNVRSAESEIMRLLSQTRPDKPSENEVAMEERPVNSEVSIKEEFDIVEWEMPANTVIKDPEAAQQFQEADKDDSNDIESDEMEPVELPEEEYEKKYNSQFFYQPLQKSTGSSVLKNCLSLEDSEATVRNSFEGESSSICTSQDIYDKNRDANKGRAVNDLRGDVVPVEKSLSTQISKSIVNVTKSGRSNLKKTLIKKKRGYICDICKKTFGKKLFLGKHVRVHYGQRPFGCSICDETFKHDDWRYQHERGHIGEKMILGKSKIGNKKLFSCSICAKKFSSKNSLSGHYIAHSDKYKCNSCGKCFQCSTNLRIHSRIHTKEKPFKCEVCFKCFSDKSNFSRHLRIHF